MSSERCFFLFFSEKLSEKETHLTKKDFTNCTHRGSYRRYTKTYNVNSSVIYSSKVVVSTAYWEWHNEKHKDKIKGCKISLMAACMVQKKRQTKQKLGMGALESSAMQRDHSVWQFQSSSSFVKYFCLNHFMSRANLQVHQFSRMFDFPI